MKPVFTFRLGYPAGALFAVVSVGALAQEQDDRTLEQVVVVGSQIIGSDIAGTLPVTVMTSRDIEATGAASGVELLGSIPQIGGVTFNEASFTGVNGARGDIGSINLRGIGTGNTLVLLNGRRLVLHPGTQVENFVPVNTVNSNALPVTGIERLEVLRDGAAAIYGTDAVAGVINTITQADYTGLDASIRYGGSEGTSLREFSVTAKYGIDFNNGASNLSVFGNLLSREPVPASQRRYSATEDLRTLFVGTPFEGDTQLRNLSSQTQWGEFRSLSGPIGALGDDDFHIQPSTFDGCLVDLGNGVCADNGGSIDTSLRLDRAGYRHLIGDTDRQNLMAFFNHDFDGGMEMFAEATWYHAEYYKERETAQILSSGRLTVPSNAFYNPFGVDLQIRDYRPVDAGVRMIKVKNDSYRLLAGLRGQIHSWNWETAALYSEARTNDATNRVSNTMFQRAISRTTADAYNPFLGGNPDDINAANPSGANSQATIDSFIVPVSRIGTTSLALADMKLSTATLFDLPAGGVGIAIGVEARQEKFIDDRDDRLDGTITFTDQVTGATIGSDVMGSSPTPDTRGERTVVSAYAELAIPVIDRLDVQLAARYERFSDVGDVLKPKIALSWYPINDFQIRAAYAQGFRAPNLEQTNASGIRRVNTNREDWILCEATARANSTAFNVGDCDGFSVESVRSGGPELAPEHNDNLSFGVVYQPSGLPGLMLTLDWWRIEQRDVIGLFSDQNQISLDYLLRLQGSRNPNVVRENASVDQIATYTAAGLDPAGDIREIVDDYVNLLPRRFEGIDIGALWEIDTDRQGSFTLSMNAAYLLDAFQDPSADATALLTAINDRTINEAVDIGGAQSLVEQNGRPRWRTSASIIWANGNWAAAGFLSYTGSVIDTSVVGPNREVFVVGEFSTVSIYAQYNLEELVGRNARVRLGINNITNTDPPIADEFGSGYFDTLHSDRGRFIYVDVSVSLQDSQ